MLDQNAANDDRTADLERRSNGCVIGPGYGWWWCPPDPCTIGLFPCLDGN